MDAIGESSVCSLAHSDHVPYLSATKHSDTAWKGTTPVPASGPRDRSLELDFTEDPQFMWDRCTLNLTLKVKLPIVGVPGSLERGWSLRKLRCHL
ncbi:hypothetical protein AVEN_186485-1 [Araneus ventricosus]|uniref:Uncharacterized protein n=1 Tax=Araneus ventricosus TaxID=182803 RepID=A0A4Y2PYZ8_ARAVE|nr:hypothetical protein AVEN_186485-1 [Araneus ventricosus]